MISKPACARRHEAIGRYSPLKPDKGNNKKNLLGIVSLILWALVLTMLFKSCSNSYASANQVQVDYSTFRTWVTEELVQSVKMDSGKYVITLKEGAEDQARSELPEEDEESGTLLPWLKIQEGVKT